MAKGKASSSNGTRRLTGSRKARYQRYRTLDVAKERKVKRLVKRFGLTRAVADSIVRGGKPTPKGTRPVTSRAKTAQTPAT